MIGGCVAGASQTDADERHGRNRMSARIGIHRSGIWLSEDTRRKAKRDVLEPWAGP